MYHIINIVFQLHIYNTNIRLLMLLQSGNQNARLKKHVMKRILHWLSFKERLLI